jgi:DNA modification methylase
MSRYTLKQGDCLELLKDLPDNSVDAIVTDPPAGIAFMGKDWDKDKGGREAWKAWMKQVAEECIRVIKPGGHALVWALPRTSHWTGDAWEDAGWDVRDKVYHAFGSGFPKSLDIGKALDKAHVRTCLDCDGTGTAVTYNERGEPDDEIDCPVCKGKGEIKGAEREVVGVNESALRPNRQGRKLVGGGNDGGFYADNGATLTAPATPEAQQWDGWGTALKPAVEEWWLFRKPFRGTVAGNVLEWGTGGINVDGCRVGHSDNIPVFNKRKEPSVSTYGDGLNNGNRTGEYHTQGRFPAHLTHDGSEEVLGGFPVTVGAGNKRDMVKNHDYNASSYKISSEKKPNYYNNAGGSAARFFQSCPLDREDIEARRLFYCAKASKRDRDEGLSEEARNIHPTVKATPLMRWLCRLITPPGGLVLDPFTGSGSTGKGALLEGFRFIGFDLYAEHIEIAEARCRFALEQEQEAAKEDARQLDLFAKNGTNE